MDEKPELSPRDPPSATPMTRVIENIDDITTKKIEDLCSTLWLRAATLYISAISRMMNIEIIK
jgi:hypothetical protein